MSDQRARIEDIWAYVHGQLDADAMQRLDGLLAQDEGLRKEAEEVRRADRLFRRLLPVAEGGEEKLVERILEAVERLENTGASCKTSGKTVGVPCHRQVRRGGEPDPPGILQTGSFSPMEGRLPRRPRGFCKRLTGETAQGGVVAFPDPAGWMVRAHVWRYALGLAAAAMVALLVLPRFLGGPAHWSGTEFVPLQYRGEGAAEAPAYTPADADECQRAFREAFEGAASRLQPSRGTAGWICRAPRWDVSFRLQEMPQTRFSVTVRAAERGGRAAGEWSADFASVADFRGRAPAWADAIVADLAAGRAPVADQP